MPPTLEEQAAINLMFKQHDEEWEIIDAYYGKHITAGEYVDRMMILHLSRHETPTDEDVEMWFV